MIDLGKQACYLCRNTKAILVLRCEGAYKDYLCPTCKRYLISKDAEIFLSNEAEEFFLDILEQRQNYSRISQDMDDGYLMHVYVRATTNETTLCVDESPVKKWDMIE